MKPLPLQSNKKIHFAGNTNHRPASTKFPATSDQNASPLLRAPHHHGTRVPLSSNQLPSISPSWRPMLPTDQARAFITTDAVKMPLLLCRVCNSAACACPLSSPCSIQATGTTPPLLHSRRSITAGYPYLTAAAPLRSRPRPHPAAVSKLLNQTAPLCHDPSQDRTGLISCRRALLQSKPSRCCHHGTTTRDDERRKKQRKKRTEKRRGRKVAG
jgi:hypothetical protein